MVMTWKTFGVISIVSVILGCAAPAKQKPAAMDAILPEIDVVLVKEKSDEALKLAQEVKLDVEVLSTKITELDNRIISLSEEMAGISSAKIEEVETRLALLTEAFKDLQTQLKEVEGASLRAGKGKKAADPNAKFYPASASSLIVMPEYDAYQGGLRLYNGRNYQGAIKAFTDMVLQFPDGKYTDNAHYWIAESHFALSNFPTAINFFEKVTAVENSAKADDALYKLGLTYLKMARQGPAKETFKRLIERYPASEYAARADKYLRQLK